MQIVYKKIADLKRYEKNNKKHPEKQLIKIVASIKEYGFKNPVLIDKNNEIIAGHGRTLAAERLGMEEVPCIDCSDLNSKQVKALRLMDNKSADLAEWDFDNIKAELEELRLEEFDIDLTGFDMSDFEEEKEVKEDEFDVGEQLKKPVMSKLGDIWLLGRHRLMCGDSTDKATVEKLMDGKKADMVFTDPPYGVDYKGINNDDRKGLSELLNKAFENYFNNSKSGSSIYCFHSDKCADIFHTEFRKFFHFSSMIIWYKGFTLSQGDYQSMHEPCMYGWMNNGTHKFMGDRKQTTIWEIKKEKIEGHTTPKPLEFIAKALNNSSKSEDLVLDLFGGSGSTLLGAHQTGRNAYLMELDEKYVDVIVNRFKEFVGETKDIKCIRNGETFTYQEIFRETI